MKVIIPTSQNDITLRQYIEAQDKPEREQIGIYLNLTQEELNQVPQSVYDEALQHISKAMEEEPKHVMRFKIGSTEYGMVPELNDIESGAFADAENHATELDGAHIFLNALYRPIKRKASVFYSVKGYDARRAVSLLDAPLSVYTSTLVFFYNLAKDLGIYTQNYTK